MKARKGFTLVELMVVVLIVGILAAVAIPMMQGRIDAAKWSEARAAAGTIASGIRAYAAEKGAFTTAPSLADVGIATGDLKGSYFLDGSYAITSASYNTTDGVSFVITIDATKGVSGKAPTSTPTTRTMTVDKGGTVSWGGF